ncbi:small membrane A-kinase anchor protein isoform X1 [Hirundo rustica]|uniref:small membrane A-kinase anchor protein isoform X1 n=1 Tax=Hirundo rustica TaxID=43150 RepID=UPI001A952A44|nr:small membrane A-kinase anchor protein isoform X1 [Hirundo rustica]
MRSGKVNGVAGSLQAVFLLWGRRETTLFAAESPTRGAVCAVLGTRGQPVRSSLGSDFLRRSTKGDVLFFKNNRSHWQEAAAPPRTREPLPGHPDMQLN